MFNAWFLKGAGKIMYIDYFDFMYNDLYSHFEKSLEST